jgi:hypothetical protein
MMDQRTMSQAADLILDKKVKTYTIVNNKVGSLITIFFLHLPAHDILDSETSKEEIVEKLLIVHSILQCWVLSEMH